MDVIDFFSSEEDENYPNLYSDQARDTYSTDVDKNSSHQSKTKNIKKKQKYDPITQGGKTYRYQDNPSEYRKIRKKIQNRLSARRVRGRKQNAFENLEQEVEYLRKQNSQIHLQNARLQTQNKNLREQLDFMKGLVNKNNQNANYSHDPIDKYLSFSPQNDQQSGKSSPISSHNSTDYESPFIDDQSDWLRIPNRSVSSSSWSMLTIFTLIVALFILPSSNESSSTPTILFSNSQQTIKSGQSWIQGMLNAFWIILSSCKFLVKYALIFGYIWFIFTFGYNYMKKRKLKKV